MTKILCTLISLIVSASSFALTDSTALLHCTQDYFKTEFKVIYPLKPLNNSSPVFIRLDSQRVYMTAEDGSSFLDYFIGENETKIEYRLNEEVIRNNRRFEEYVGTITFKDGDYNGDPLVFTLNCKTIRN